MLFSTNVMSRLRTIPYADWLLGGLMFLLCAALTVMQYRWTGEVARAEAVRLRGNLDEQAQGVARAFDAELSSSCDQLIPQRQDFADQSRESAHLERFKEWKAGHSRPIFKRIGLGVASGNEIRLTLLDQTSAQFIPTNWPAAWAPLHDGFLKKLAGGRPPSSDERGMLLEFPVFGSRESRGEHWLILELDLDYARDRWLPELIATHLNSGERNFNQARVRLGRSSSSMLYETTNAEPRADGPVASVRFNLLGRTGNSRLPARGGGHWLLEAWRPRGALEAAVAASHRRNFAIAAAVNLLMLTTGVALVLFARRARRLAAQQMNFVATVSHELRTPLTVIRGAGHNLLRGVVTERAKVEQYAQLILKHAEQLTEMVEQTLALAGAHRGAAPPRGSVALAGVLEEAVAAVAEDTQAAGCEVHTEVPSSLPPVTGDAAALRRVFQNLLDNAIKHGGGGGWISVRAAVLNGTHPPMVEVRVSDRGPGIPADEQAGIFQPFVRGAAAQENQIRGSGLGLSVVREIVEAHGGSVSLESDAGRGATFTVRLPAVSGNHRE
jgi:signal transduction histidine kinase